MEKTIEAKELRKSFKDTEVLKGVNFEVKQGEIFAFWAQTTRAKPR